jgi:hypothetical protein
MEVFTETEIRDFTIRGHYVNQRSLLSRIDLHSRKIENVPPNSPGSSPPVVEFEVRNGQTGSIVVSEVDIPSLCNDDFEKAKQHLGQILRARQGDPEAARNLSSEM